MGMADPITCKIEVTMGYSIHDRIEIEMHSSQHIRFMVYQDQAGLLYRTHVS